MASNSERDLARRSLLPLNCLMVRFDAGALALPRLSTAWQRLWCGRGICSSLQTAACCPMPIPQKRATDVLSARETREPDGAVAPITPATLGVARGAAFYVASLIGPGLLLIPALALRAAGPASVLAWICLLILSIPLAAVFVALGVRHPVAGGVAAYARAGLGARAGAMTGACFLAAVTLGVPAVALTGGLYVAELTAHGTSVAILTGAAMLIVVLLANRAGLGASARLALGLSGLLIAVVATAVATSLPGHIGHHWTPFAPHGWLALGTAANLLIFLFVGWEAAAPMAGEFRDPARQLPRAAGIAFGIVTVLYLGLAVATVAVVTHTNSNVPLADLIGVGFGSAGRDTTAVLAVVLSLGTMNVYVGGAAKLASALARDGHLPAWLRAAEDQSVPHRSLGVILAVGAVELVALAAGIGTPDVLFHASSACFAAVYVLSLAAAVRLLDGPMRAAARVTLAMMLIVAAFAGAYLLIPLAVAAASIGLPRGVSSNRGART